MQLGVLRLGVILGSVWLTACASDKLAQAPPPGVDFSGHWALNEADSDDPQRLVQAQFNQSTSPERDPSTGGGSGGGRGGRQGGRGGGGMMPAGTGGPVMPSVGALGDALRWPGKQLEIKQVAGVVAFISGGASRVCQPMEGGGSHHHHPPKSDHDGRDAPPRSREAPPPRCGWQEKTLIVRSSDPDDDRPPFEEHYSLSEDGKRLVEVVGFRGGRSAGYTLSRVWDHVP